MSPKAANRPYTASAVVNCRHGRACVLSHGMEGSGRIPQGHAVTVDPFA